MLDRLRSFAIPAAIVLLLVWVALSGSGLGSGNLAPGTRIESFTLTNLADGKATDLASLVSDGPVALHIFATWCGACMREWPSLEGIAARHGEDLRLIPIGLDQPSALRDLVRKKPIGVPVFVGGEAVERALRVPMYPYTVFVGPNLRVIHDHAGIVGDRAFLSAIQRLKAAPEATVPARVAQR
jgi:thiol-disulfide isomerase/thioredoxin